MGMTIASMAGGVITFVAGKLLSFETNDQDAESSLIKLENLLLIFINNNTGGQTRSEIAFASRGDAGATLPYDIGHRYASISGIVRNFIYNNAVTSGSLSFSTRESTSASLEQKMLLNFNGNLIIQNGGTFTDSGQRLQVNGDTLLKGSGNTSASTALTVQDSAGTNLLRVRNDSTTSINYLRVGNSFSTSPFVFSFLTNEGTPDVTGRNLSFYSNTGSLSATGGVFTFTGDPLIQTSGSQIFLRTNNAFSPTSGTATLDIFRITWNINQTGGANGITRGIYVSVYIPAEQINKWKNIKNKSKFVQQAINNQ